jgi:hypothetical protein
MNPATTVGGVRASGVRVIAAVALAGLGLVPAAVRTHHSLAGVYDSSKQVKVEGDVARFHFVNPHPYLTVTVKGADGRSADWRLEMDNRFELEAIGMTSASFSRGDRILASGSRGHGDANSLYIRRLDRPLDGFWYEQIGSTPSVGRKALQVISEIARSR